MSSLSFAQDAGDEDLEAAFSLKIKAEKVGDYEEVVELCKSAIEKGLDDEGELEAKTLAAAALFEQGEQLMIRMRGQRDPTFFRNQAVKVLKEAVEFDPEMGDAWLSIAKLNLLRGGDPEEAISAIDKSISLLDEQPQKRSEAYYLRSIMTQREDRESSREDLDKAIELDESNINALRARSAFQILEGDIEAGLKDSNTILELNEGNTDMLDAQGIALSRLAQAKTAASLRPENTNEETDDEDPDGIPKQSKEELEADAEKIHEAVLEIYSKAVELAPEDEGLNLKKVTSLSILEKEEDALEAINEYLELNEDSIKALQMKAQILSIDEENDEETLKVLDKAIRLDSYDKSTRRLRMRFFDSRQQYPKAVREANKILEKDPNDMEVMSQLAILYSLDEKPKKAIEIYSGLLNRIPAAALSQLAPRNRILLSLQRIGTLRSRGDSYLSTGEHENAIEDYEEALELGDSIEDIQASIANVSFEYTPDDGVLNNLAWVLATSTFKELRDGKRAIELATRACEVTDYKAPHILSTLASGYAEAGDFDKAVEWIEKGLKVNEEREITDFLPEEAIEQQRESLEKELKSYRDKKPWRENQAEEDAAKAKEEKKKSKDKDDDKDEDDKDEDEDK